MIVAVVGVVLVAVGVLLLVLPGPGLLIVLAGLLVLATEFPAVDRYVVPVRRRALRAADDSVSSPLRIAASIAGGLWLIGAGVAWGLVDWLPFAGWSAGTSLILSGFIVLGLVVWSYRRTRTRQRAGTHD
ncbi:PGPGW domain-containing protein [Cryptosporangium aurantiacum]|uniref:PGPGW domain-containing protein n=1 Tax=Cryptosporangium aurantiacum TaxID=134849 RepID=UPI000A0410C0